MARIRTIRRFEGAAASVGVGLVLLLAALAWRHLDPPADAADGDPGLLAMGAACSEELHGDARTASMTPDAARGRAPDDGRDLAGPRTSASPPGAAPPAAGDADATPGPERRLRLTDYGWAARNMNLRNDPCTKFYRRRLALGR